MLKTGRDFLNGLNDGRVVYVGGDRVEDIAAHPGFRGAARSLAALYDWKADHAQRGILSFAEDGDDYSMWFLRPRCREDLARRMRAHKLIADFSFGLFGRAPDHTGSTLTGLAMGAAVFDRIGPGFGANILRHYEYSRRNDIFAAYAIVPPPGARDPDFHARSGKPTPGLRVVSERDDGVVISGMKMLATGAVYADEIWIGNAHPVAPSQTAEAITCAVPCNAPGLSLWSRKPLASELMSPFDYPLAAHFDESDAIVMCESVFVPWERVFVHRDTEMTRHIYQQTPGQCLGNHQSNVRFWAKLGLLCGVLNRVAKVSGTDNIPAVRDMLGQMASYEALIGGLVHGQIDAFENWPGGPEGYVCFNRRIMYAALNWCTENHSAIVEMLRELTGGSIFQMPADVSVLGNEELAGKFDAHWWSANASARDRMKLYRLAWDLVGFEFAGRHLQYEKFYSGPGVVVRAHSVREAPWATFDAIAERATALQDRSDGAAPSGEGLPRVW
ncbi:MAG TPA: 4-hydroxyphenylacetate 3-hydroxylase N-terminal domain-containing protein [Stellaceae bacterium]|jgi:4-hydroxyphenylacetate 3-monooxygenase